MFDKRPRTVTPAGEDCELCENQRWVCPGCTRGRIGHALFMGCGVPLRCPWCVDYNGAMEDQIVMDNRRSSRRAKEEQCKKIRAAIRAKYPDWDEQENELVLLDF